MQRSERSVRVTRDSLEAAQTMTTNTHTHTPARFEERWGVTPKKKKKLPEQLTNHSPAGRRDRVHTSAADRPASVMLSAGRDLN